MQNNSINYIFFHCSLYNYRKPCFFRYSVPNARSAFLWKPSIEMDVFLNFATKKRKKRERSKPNDISFYFCFLFAPSPRSFTFPCWCWFRTMHNTSTSNTMHKHILQLGNIIICIESVQIFFESKFFVFFFWRQNQVSSYVVESYFYISHKLIQLHNCTLLHYHLLYWICFIWFCVPQQISFVPWFRIWNDPCASFRFLFWHFPIYNWALPDSIHHSRMGSDHFCTKWTTTASTRTSKRIYRAQMHKFKCTRLADWFAPEFSHFYPHHNHNANRNKSAQNAHQSFSIDLFSSFRWWWRVLCACVCLMNIWWTITWWFKWRMWAASALLNSIRTSWVNVCKGQPLLASEWIW